jgi:hypothetical protein
LALLCATAISAPPMPTVFFISLGVSGWRREGRCAQRGQCRNEGSTFHMEAPMCALSSTPSPHHSLSRGLNGS